MRLSLRPKASGGVSQRFPNCARIQPRVHLVRFSERIQVRSPIWRCVHTTWENWFRIALEHILEITTSTHGNRSAVCCLPSRDYRIEQTKDCTYQQHPDPPTQSCPATLRRATEFKSSTTSRRRCRCLLESTNFSSTRQHLDCSFFVLHYSTKKKKTAHPFRIPTNHMPRWVRVLLDSLSRQND